MDFRLEIQQKKRNSVEKKSKIRLSFLTFQSLYIVDKRLFFFETESRELWMAT